MGVGEESELVEELLKPFSRAGEEEDVVGVFDVGDDDGVEGEVVWVMRGLESREEEDEEERGKGVALHHPVSRLESFGDSSSSLHPSRCRLVHHPNRVEQPPSEPSLVQLDPERGAVDVVEGLRRVEESSPDRRLLRRMSIQHRPKKKGSSLGPPASSKSVLGLWEDSLFLDHEGETLVEGEGEELEDDADEGDGTIAGRIRRVLSWLEDGLEEVERERRGEGLVSEDVVEEVGECCCLDPPQVAELQPICSSCRARRLPLLHLLHHVLDLPFLEQPLQIVLVADRLRSFPESFVDRLVEPTSGEIEVRRERGGTMGDGAEVGSLFLQRNLGGRSDFVEGSNDAPESSRVRRVDDLLPVGCTSATGSVPTEAEDLLLDALVLETEE